MIGLSPLLSEICEDNEIDFLTMKKWYDGYYFHDVGSVFNPNSVMHAIENKGFDSYWTETSAAESLLEYISMDFDGLGKTVTELLGGGSVSVSTLGFTNDLTTFRNKDDVQILKGKSLE